MITCTGLAVWDTGKNNNTISDALTGVTLNLQQAEVGTTVSLNVSRDVDALTARVKAVSDAYNALVKFRGEQQADGKPLKGNHTLRSSIASITAQLLSNVVGLSGSFNRAGRSELSITV